MSTRRLLARLDGRLVGVASYEPTGRPGVAEIAFAVSDEMHGRGVATLLLEHLVSLARQRRLTAFAAETLPDNVAMQRVFADAGLPVERQFADGVIELVMPLPGHDGDQLDQYLDAVAGRASRAEVASLRHLLLPASVAVIGAGRRRGLGRPGDPAQHRRGRLHRAGLSGQPARPLHGGPDAASRRRLTCRSASTSR